MIKDYYSALAQRAVNDEAAFEELYEYFFPRVYNFIFARLKNVADADDVTSITFMKMNENLESYDSTKAAFSPIWSKDRRRKVFKPFRRPKYFSFWQVLGEE